jgi:ribosomal protein L28
MLPLKKQNKTKQNKTKKTQKPNVGAVAYTCNPGGKM